MVSKEGILSTRVQRKRKVERGVGAKVKDEKKVRPFVTTLGQATADKVGTRSQFFA